MNKQIKKTKGNIILHHPTKLMPQYEKHQIQQQKFCCLVHLDSSMDRTSQQLVFVIVCYILTFIPRFSNAPNDDQCQFNQKYFYNPCQRFILIVSVVSSSVREYAKTSEGAMSDLPQKLSMSPIIQQ